MDNLMRRSRSFLPKTSFHRRLGCILLLLLVVVAPLTINIIHDQVSSNQATNNGISLSRHNNPSKSHTHSPQPSHPSPHVNSGCGVTRNPDGTYTFSWLHIVNGSMLDATNCTVHLLGVNMGGMFLASAGHPGPSSIAWYKQHIPMNVVREAFNAYWWNTNVYVPDQRMHYRQWLQTVVSWQEAQGNYVILDDATQFHNLPCGNDGMGYNVSKCPSQNQADKNNPPDPTEKDTYQPTALAAFTDLATIYSNDPAVIFDVWNEATSKQLHGVPEQTFFQDMNDRINTVRQYDPRSLVMVYDHGFSDIIAGKFPNYTQPNLLWDTHIYASSWSPASGTASSVAFAHAHNQAYIIGEWGGLPGAPSPATIMPFIATNDLASTYFIADNLINGNPEKPISLNSIGQAVANDYAAIFASQ